MPEEYRKMVFSSVEVFDSVREFCEGKGTLLPHDDVRELKFTDQPDQPVAITYITGARSSPTSITLSRDQLAAALIQYCRRRRVPVPRGGRKILTVNKNEVSLMVHVPEKG